ncbi:hypothetical protein [Pseudobacillus badius]|uniref:hypothetical protein n=1 Tax=Bacillus badius TaxID=1455 RepID=UPI0007B09B66|nr:hypothetical protein [Bacillus badius]KZO01254.1 hypothetical protein A4244_13390 [Bacillus badius]MED0667942.1 hypothetical protein [Bacillus badius]OCS89432.1 hypothetical protein A6M11_13410 [Bacillus badius]OVE51190.1 hypothetical protein B1A98_12460 [Bacillus badius]TDW02179.1 hypothetical protein B0G66_1079 [Bacillus badius]
MNAFLLRSQREELPLVIMYQAQDGTITKRTIIVKSLSSSAVYAYCFYRKQNRRFLLSNILAVYPASVLRRKIRPA